MDPISIILNIVTRIIVIGPIPVLLFRAISWVLGFLLQPIVYVLNPAIREKRKTASSKQLHKRQQELFKNLLSAYGSKCDLKPIFDRHSVPEIHRVAYSDIIILSLALNYRLRITWQTSGELSAKDLTKELIRVGIPKKVSWMLAKLTVEYGKINPISMERAFLELAHQGVSKS